MAKDKGVNITTFDSTYKVDKIKMYHPECELVLHIRCGDPNATISLGSKYGANHNEIPNLLQYAFDQQMKVVGISFPDAQSKFTPFFKRAFRRTSSSLHFIA